MELVVDDRERAVIPHLEDQSHDFRIAYRVQRMEVGDYALTYRGHVVFIIERKTWEDLAASMRDGRKDNIQKLLKLRTETKCQIIYLIEGSNLIRPKTLVARIPFKNLRAHLDHIAFRDAVHLVYTTDVKNTAFRLFELVSNYSSIKRGGDSPHACLTFEQINQTIDEAPAISSTHSDRTTALGSTMVPNISSIAITLQGPATFLETGEEFLETRLNPENKMGVDVSQQTIIPGNAEKLTERQASSINIQTQLLRCLPSIGSTISDLLGENGISLHDIYSQKCTEDQIASLKFSGGVSIGLVKARKILANRSHLISKSQVSRKIQLRILEVVPLISKSTAIKILEQVTFADIMSGKVTVDILKNIPRSEKSDIGQKAAENIINYLIAGRLSAGDILRLNDADQCIDQHNDISDNQTATEQAIADMLNAPEPSQQIDHTMKHSQPLEQAKQPRTRRTLLNTIKLN